MYSKALELPKGVVILKAVPAASHLSSASIYPSCLAPYLISTMCSDSSIRFWRCCADLVNSGGLLKILGIVDSITADFEYKWIEWTMQLQEQHSSTIFLKENQIPLEISCAYSGRVAVAYSDHILNSQKEKIRNINVAIFECESTGMAMGFCVVL